MDIGVLADVATAVAVVAAVAFGIAQFRQQDRNRREAAAIDFVRAFQTPEFRRAWTQVLDLPEDADPQEIQRRPEIRDAAHAVDIAMESWGLLVFKDVVDLHSVDHLAGGSVRQAWRRLRRFAEEERRRRGEPSYAEWFQWLAERMEEDPAPGKSEGAHVAFRRWRRG
ncbi:MAG TPA: hypothetical protein VI796_07065 [Candidatus Thermoplasmatota archaeon]|nr:hypothetical protein [Candidatus Thermoplasmatota archaeon]